MNIPFKRIAKNIPIPTFIVWGLYASLTGEIPKGEDVGDALSHVDVWLYREVGHPTLFLLFLGFAVAWISYWIVRGLLRLDRKRETLKEFMRRLDEIGETKILFFRLLRRAYKKYRENVLNAGSLEFYGRLDEDFNKFLDSVDYPNWLDGRSAELSEVVNANLNQREPGWNFTVTLYREIEDKRAEGYPPLLTDDEAVALHTCRQKLSYFFDSVGENLSTGLLDYQKIVEQLRNNDRFIKILCFLSVVLFCLNHQTGSGPKHLYKLGRMVLS